MAKDRGPSSCCDDVASCFYRSRVAACLRSCGLTRNCRSCSQESCAVRTYRHRRAGRGRLFSLNLLLVYASLPALLTTASAQDLFVGSERPAVAADQRHHTLLDRLRASIFKSWMGDRETTGDRASFRDSELQGLLVNESRADITSQAGSSAPVRRLPGDGEKSSLIIKTMIFGEMGENEERPLDERRVEAEQWMFVVIGKSINTGRSNSAINFDFESLGDDPPEMAWYEVEPYDADPNAPGGPEKDQRSPMKRTHFSFSIKHLPSDQAKQFARNFCLDYKEREEELLQGFLRAFENADLYPDEGWKAASNLKSGVKSFIHLQSQAKRESDGKITFECDNTQAKPSSDQGILFLPDCPENSMRCSQRPELCTEEERSKGWMCKCLFGYDTKIELVGVDNMDEVTKRFQYVGQCEKTRGFCPPQSKHGDVMEREDASIAWGTIGETARPRCSNGYFNTGTSECMGTSREQGSWTPERWCKFDPPREPPALDCEEPDPTDQTIVATRCKYCRPSRPSLSETTCKCTVQCADGYKEVAGIAEGPKKCVDHDFRPQCPPKDELNWNPHEDEGKRCRHGDFSLTKDFCCNEAWGANAPKELEPTPKCSDLTKDDQCLSHYQADSGKPPCCWNELGYKKDLSGGPGPWCAALGDTTLITGQPHTQPQACAVSPRIPDARWEDFPKCEKTCTDIFKDYSSLVANGCDNCVPGEVDCGCDVKCKEPLIWVGGGAEGPRQCESTTGSFEQPPVCLEPEPAPRCPAKQESTNYTITGCEVCTAGSSCQCAVECAPGYKLVGSVPTGEKMCLEKPRSLEAAECSSLKEREMCLNSRSVLEQHEGAPCCWIPDTETCQPRGSKDTVTISSPPEKCAYEKRAEWDEFPQCEMKCENIFTGVPNVVKSGSCDDCIASDPEACGCSVECKPGSFHVGGGPVGDRKCLSVGGLPRFGKAPVCMIPQDKSASFIPGTSEVRSKCSNPLSGVNGRVFTGCTDCEAEPEAELRFLQGSPRRLADKKPCTCKVACSTNFKRVGAVESGEKTCREVKNDLRSMSCSSIRSREECFSSSQAGGDQDGEPCCWKSGGFKAAGGGAECAARGSPDIEQAPERCARTLTGKWDEFPTCVEKCENIYKRPEFNWKVSHEGCDDCIPGEHCPCQVRCANDPRTWERRVRVGGGPEVWGPQESVQCPADRKFPEPPICQKKLQAGQADPTCLPPFLVGFTMTKSFCVGCVADKECTCHVSCAPGYKQTPQTLSKTGDLQGVKQCKSIPATLSSGKDCIQISNDQECTRSKNKADGKPCCWRKAGFLRNGVPDPRLQCAPIGDGQYIGFELSKGEPTLPDQCAAIKSFEWDPMPKCHALCTNSFKGENLVVSPECNECFPDFPEDCKCTVNCLPIKSTFFKGDGEQGPQKCGTNQQYPTSFPPAPRCVSPTPPDAETCGQPEDRNFMLDTLDIDRCPAGCIARKDDAPCKDCKVYCASGYKSVGDVKEGKQVCKEVIFRCPKKVDYDHVSQCTDRATGKATKLWCCGEAHFTPADYEKADCGTINSEHFDDPKDICLHRMDQASGKDCCWRESKYKNGNQCAAAEGDDIDDEHLPDECANRPTVFTGEWKAMPQCEKTCEDIFTRAKDNGKPLFVKDCGDCVQSMPHECKCTVRCDAGPDKPVVVRVGGGKEGPRTCIPESGFGKLPICAAPDSTPVCDAPQGVGFLPAGCQNCVAGERCACTVACAPTFKDISGLATLSKRCNKIPIILISRDCTSIAERNTCLSSKDVGHLPSLEQRCCWRDEGFSHDGLLPPHCLPEYSEAMEGAPTACAAKEKAEWDEMPVCKPFCRNVFARTEYLTTTPECETCVAGRPCPDCKVDCRSGYIHIGGNPPGSWQCTEDQIDFTDPPLCMQAPPVKFCSHDFTKEESLEVHGCTRCIPGSLCQDGCLVKCAARFLETTKVDKTGMKMCKWVDKASVKEAVCRNLGDSEDQCLHAKEDGEPCCYHAKGLGSKQSGPKCLRKGDPDIKVLPLACAVTKEHKWDEMPSCEHSCEHFFVGVPNIAWEKSRCSNVCWMGGPCNCEVNCQSDAFERIGGGVPGPRSCPSSKQSSMHWMEDPPVCWKKPDAPVCDVSTIPAWIKAAGCNNCVAGQDCPSCKVACASGFQHVAGALGNKKCKLEQNKLLTSVRNCEALKKEDCLKSFQTPWASNTPCCYRAEGFVTRRVVCTATNSPKLTSSSRPDQCAVMHSGVWEQMPDCRQECQNIFRGFANLLQDNIGKCDHCIVGEYCPCIVQCAPGTFPVAGSGAIGIRECKEIRQGFRPSFDPPPQCEPACEVPDDKQGTLNLDNCKERCFPGLPCNCRISCAAGNRWNGGGQEALPLRCKRSTEKSAAFVGLPTCNPVCYPPDDQFQTMDTSRCQDKCQADSNNCHCEVKCYGKHDQSEGGGVPGKKTCKFVPGNRNTPASAIWVNADKSTWGQPGYDEMPNCMNPLLIKVMDARNQQPVQGAKIVVMDQQNRHRTEARKTSNANGLAVVFTMLTDLFFEVTKDGYSKQETRFNRLIQCDGKPEDCSLSFFLNRKLNSGDIHPNGCYFTTKPSKANWEMRAILSWNQRPADLDIWVRNADCAEDARIRYRCFDDTDYGYRGDRDRCSRSDFTTVRTHKIERQACRSKLCVVDDNGVTEEGKREDGTWGPICPEDAGNQFPKWVFWGARESDRLSYRIDGSVGKKLERYGDWTEDNYIWLNTDQMQGKGPETVTFHNVPPGTYQIAVDQFSSNEDSLNIKDGYPFIHLFLGGNDVMAICEIDEACRKNARVWNALNIKVEDMGERLSNGERKYRIRIIDQQSKMHKLHPYNIPTDNITGSMSRWVPDPRFKGKYIAKPENYFFTSINNAEGYFTDELNDVCYGKCKLADGSLNFEDCIDRS